MTVVFPLRYKKSSPPVVLPLPSLSCFRARQCSHSCFPLRLVFGHPATSPSLPLLRPLLEQAIRRLCRQPPEEARKKTERRTPACIADHGSVLGDVRVPPLDACSDAPLHRQWSLSYFSFPCTHSSSASSWTALRQWGEHHVSFTLFEFSLPRSVSKYIFLLCNLCLVGRHCSNLVAESRDEILFKGGRLWRPRFSTEFLNPNKPGQLSWLWSNDGQPGPSPWKHHRQSLMTHFGQPWSTFGQNPSQTP
jgi:hypothetical protein